MWHELILRFESWLQYNRENQNWRSKETDFSNTTVLNPSNVSNKRIQLPALIPNHTLKEDPVKEILMSGENNNCLFFSLTHVFWPNLPIKCEEFKLRAKELRQVACDWWDNVFNVNVQDLISLFDDEFNNSEYDQYHKSNYKSQIDLQKIKSRFNYLQAIRFNPNGAHMGGRLELIAISHQFNISIQVLIYENSIPMFYNPPQPKQGLYRIIYHQSQRHFNALMIQTSDNLPNELFAENQIYEPPMNNNEINNQKEKSDEQQKRLDYDEEGLHENELDNKEILERLAEYSYDFKRDEFSKQTPNWRLILTLLLDGDKSVKWTNFVAGEFKILDVERFIKSISNLTNGGRILTKNNINRNLNNRTNHLSFHQNKKFSFIHFQKLVNFEYVPRVGILKGKCRQRDSNGIQCRVMNNKANEYSKHQKRHLDGILDCPKCHLQLSPFEHNNPGKILERHLKLHENENTSRTMNLLSVAF